MSAMPCAGNGVHAFRKMQRFHGAFLDRTARRYLSGAAFAGKPCLNGARMYGWVKGKKPNCGRGNREVPAAAGGAGAGRTSAKQRHGTYKDGRPPETFAPDGLPAVCLCPQAVCERHFLCRWGNDGEKTPYASIAPCAASNCFSAFMIGHHSVNARTIGTPRPMMDMQRQLINSFLASIYVLLCIVGYSFRRRADWFRGGRMCSPAEPDRRPLSYSIIYPSPAKIPVRIARNGQIHRKDRPEARRKKSGAENAQRAGRRAPAGSGAVRQGAAGGGNC